MAVIRGTEKAAHDLFMRGLVKGTTHLAAGPRGGGGRRERGAAAGRLRVRDLPRPPPRDRPRRHPRGLPGRADAEGDRRLQGQGRLDAPDPGRPRDARVVRHRRRAPADGERRGLVGDGCAGRRRSRSPSSATAPRTSARSTRRSTSPRCGSCRCIFVCENNLYMEYTPIGVRHLGAEPGRGPGSGQRHARRARRRQRRGRRARGDDRAVERARAGDGPDRRRGADLPPLRAQPHRPGEVPTGGGGARSGWPATR